ncbi:MAG: PP2C family protein-serine/threonine phosphatase [Cyanobacteriota bacterium]
MTAVPIPRQSPQNGNRSNSGVPPQDTPPVFALKELVSRLHKEQRKVQNLLSSLGFALRSFNNLNQFLELIPLMSARVADADGSAVIQFKANGQVILEQLYCQDSNPCQDLRQALEQATREVSHAAMQSQATQLRAIHGLLDAKIKQHLGPNIQLFSTPILVKSQERGRLYVFSHSPDYTWTTTREKLVQLVADQTAVAIANNELTVELRQKERLERELEIASEIQFHLLPRQCPKIEGVELAASCKTASRVGGDYYDFIPTNYDQPSSNNDAKGKSHSVPWSIVIGDVMGKGVPAGLIMTMTRGMLRAEVLNRHTPARILQHLNRVMYADLENSHRFVTLFYSEYDPQTGILSYSNAAHHPPLLWQAESGKIQHLDTWGMLIGLDADSEYEDAQVQLSPGDTIIYYTDGFTDAVNSNGDRFDEENLIQAFQWACQHCESPKAILNHLFHEVGTFTGAENANGDDMTLVVMQLKSSE